MPVRCLRARYRCNQVPANRCAKRGKADALRRTANGGLGSPGAGLQFITWATASKRLPAVYLQRIQSLRFMPDASTGHTIPESTHPTKSADWESHRHGFPLRPGYTALTNHVDRTLLPCHRFACAQIVHCRKRRVRLVKHSVNMYLFHGRKTPSHKQQEVNCMNSSFHATEVRQQEDWLPGRQSPLWVISSWPGQSQLTGCS
jgi:hypothetical protein